MAVVVDKQASEQAIHKEEAKATSNKQKATNCVMTTNAGLKLKKSQTQQEICLRRRNKQEAN